MKYLIVLLSLFLSLCTGKIHTQIHTNALRVEVSDGQQPLQFATVRLTNLALGGNTDSLGIVVFNQLPEGDVDVQIELVGYFVQKTSTRVIANQMNTLQVALVARTLDEIVVTGTMKENRRSDSPIPVEIITPKLFQRNPVPNLFEAVAMVSGVQPVIGCNVCNTGDIHINGMEGPYTLVLLDGMPIVSGLGTVYGIMGIPNSQIERIEVVKGPAGALYGSESMAGMINVITKSPENAPRLSIDLFGTSWGELNIDAGTKFRVSKKVESLLGISTFLYDRPIDNNLDGFTDMTLQKRASIFNKWQWKRPDNRLAQIAIRYVHEDRWGGQMNWAPAFSGGDSIYGESIGTRRAEVFGAWQLPVREKIITQFSYNTHRQDSYYGTTSYDARQDIGFVQSYWDNNWRNHSYLVGAAFRYTLYNDNTPATPKSSVTRLPGLFVQDEWTLAKQLCLLTGLRTDFHPAHGTVWSPRAALRVAPTQYHTLRISAGSGFRVVNLFTEDHAALSGAREVVIAAALRPERSWGGNFNWNWKIPKDRWYLGVDLTGFYTYFSNRIQADYDTDPGLIIYDNLRGNAVTRGMTLQLDYSDFRPFKVLLGVTYMDVFQRELNGDDTWTKVNQVHAPHWSGTWSLNYTHPKSRLTFDLTGNWFGPQRLPILPNDFRPEYSPWYGLVNLQASRKCRHNIEIYMGVKNLFNFVPLNPIMRPQDPFDKFVDDPINNPNGFTFDPTYNYASLQGIRGFAGIRFNL